MKNIFKLTLLLLLVSCSKEKKKEIQTNLVIEAMTNGQWKVSSYNKGGTDITSEFTNYKFQFYKNLSVDAIKSGTLEKSGSWNADANAMTITSNFAGAVDPLAHLNGTWTITSTTWTSVNATQNVSGEIRNLRLDKL
jgi:hypothetical protein